MRCVVYRSKEDLWFLEKQREAVRRLYGVELLVAGHPDSEGDFDIMLEHGPSCWPGLFLDSARQIIERFPEDTLLFEGDMIPNVAMELVPTIRNYCGGLWPSVVFTGDATVDTSGTWRRPHDVMEPFKDFKHMFFQRFPEHDNFETIGENDEFLHPQGGGRIYRDTARISRFKEWVQKMQTPNTYAATEDHT